MVLDFQASLFRPDKGVKYCNQGASVCLFSVYLSARISRNNTNVQISPHFLYTLPVRGSPWLGSPLTVMQYVMYFWYCG